jgi:hypothetical protein
MKIAQLRLGYFHAQFEFEPVAFCECKTSHWFGEAIKGNGSLLTSLLSGKAARYPVRGTT